MNVEHQKLKGATLLFSGACLTIKERTKNQQLKRVFLGVNRKAISF